MKGMMILLLVAVVGGGYYFLTGKSAPAGVDNLTDAAAGAAQVAVEKGGDVVGDNIAAVKEQAIEKGKEVVDGATEAVVEEGREKIGEAVKGVGETIADTKDDVMEKADVAVGGNDIATAGSFEDYAADKIGSNDKVVIDFAAEWCPSCRAFERDVQVNADSIPADLTILKADYDTEKDLKKKYGVTLQHTFVQVDAEGELVAKWTGSPNLEQFLTKVQ